MRDCDPRAVLLDCVRVIAKVLFLSMFSRSDVELFHCGINVMIILFVDLEL